MRHILADLRESLRVSIWFIPMLFCIGAFCLAVILLAIERGVMLSANDIEVFSMSVSSARQVLGVVAGSVLSVGGVVFSVTMVALTLTSGQYGPKVLRQFLGDWQSKVSLGLFLGTSVYALVVLAGYGDTDKPSITVIVALALVILSLGGFIQFIHSTATDLQADKIVEGIGRELCKGLLRLVEHERPDNFLLDTASWRLQVRASSPLILAGQEVGYVQAINYERLTQWCEKHDCYLLVRVRAGDFVVPGSSVAGVYCCTQDLVAQHGKFLRDCILTGPIRTPVQDPEFPITQLNQLCARALSPGINDPGTAITCIDWFSVAMASIIDKQFLGNVYRDSAGRSRLLARGTGFEGIATAFYAPVRQLSDGNMPVMIALLESLIRLTELTRQTSRLAVLSREAYLLRQQVQLGQHSEFDITAFNQRYKKLQRVTGRRQSL